MLDRASALRKGWTVMTEKLPRFFTFLGVYAAHPISFLIVLVYAVGWTIFDRESFNWHAVATLVTWVMTLFIQRAEHRDTQAVHAKLDELLRALPGAKTDIAAIDQKEPEAIAEHRSAHHKSIQGDDSSRKSRN
jgi:low affinity Fe/Cu permease